MLAVGSFRTTGAGTKYAISKTQTGALAYGAASLAVTPTKVHAFKYKLKRSGVAVKEEVAVCRGGREGRL